MNKSGQVDPWHLRAKMEKDGKCIVAGWHTHPDVPDRRFEEFSDMFDENNKRTGDIVFTIQSKVPEYLGTYLRTVQRLPKSPSKNWRGDVVTVRGPQRSFPSNIRR
ncbi:hypothetical protein AGMMS49543_24010 [Betaproteobacteria bacterium]|nr:hypothetical protein AGMMS49543_24010 [Betaproteobacteria bacterium]